MRKIEVDDDVFEFLKKEAIPFEDTPNSVLRRLLLDQSMDSNLVQESAVPSYIRKSHGRYNSHASSEIPELPTYLPAALIHTMQMIKLVIENRLSRVEATKQLADYHDVHFATIADKFTRQLNLSVYQLDALLTQKPPSEIVEILYKHYPRFKEEIQSFYNNLKWSNR